MPLTLYPPRPPKTATWVIRGTLKARVGGGFKSVYVQEATGTADYELAETIRIKREAEILDELVYGKKVSRTLQEAVVGYAEEKDRSDKPLRGTQRANVLGRERRDGTLSPHLLSRFDPDVLCNAIDQEMVDAVIRKFPRGTS